MATGSLRPEARVVGVLLQPLTEHLRTTPAPGQGTVFAFGSELLISVQYTLTPSVAMAVGEFSPVANASG